MRQVEEKDKDGELDESGPKGFLSLFSGNEVNQRKGSKNETFLIRPDIGSDSINERKINNNKISDFCYSGPKEGKKYLISFTGFELKSLVALRQKVKGQFSK